MRAFAWLHQLPPYSVHSVAHQYLIRYIHLSCSSVSGSCISIYNNKEIKFLDTFFFVYPFFVRLSLTPQQWRVSYLPSSVPTYMTRAHTSLNISLARIDTESDCNTYWSCPDSSLKKFVRTVAKEFLRSAVFATSPSSQPARSVCFIRVLTHPVYNRGVPSPNLSRFFFDKGTHSYINSKKLLEPLQS
jgi:hypothetical protein